MLPSIGVFGTDKLAQIIISLFKDAGFPVTMVCGQSDQQASAIARDYGVTFHTTKIQELLLHNDVDMVCVSGTPHQCAEVSNNALGIGKHVFTCVPCGLTLTDAKIMLSKAQYFPTLLSLLNHPLRFVPAFVRARELICDYSIGDVFLVECNVYTSSLIGPSYDWHCDIKMGGGLLHTFGSHMIDILTFLLNEKAKEVHGLVETFLKQTNNLPKFRQLSSDDFCSFQLKYAKNIVASVNLNAHMPYGFSQEIFIIGTKGYLKIVNCDLHGHINKKSMEELYREQSDQNYLSSCYYPDSYSLGLTNMIKGIKLAFQHSQNVLGQSLETDKRIADHNLIAEAANFENGCYTRCVLDAILQSNKEKRWVTIKEDGNDEASQSCYWDRKEFLFCHPEIDNDFAHPAPPPHPRRISSQPVMLRKEVNDEISFSEALLEIENSR